MSEETFRYRIGDARTGVGFATRDEAEQWADTNIAGGVYSIEKIVWCASCGDWVIFTTTEDGCPDCAGKWTPMGDGDWYAFDGGDRKRHQAYLAQQAREQDALKAWQRASAWVNQ